MSDFPHDDWVSCVSCQLPGYAPPSFNSTGLIIRRHFITSSYDGHVRSFDYSKNMTSDALLHNAAITSICLLPSSPSPAEAQTITVATASHDLTGQLSQLTVSDISSSELTSNSKTHASAKSLATLNLHTAPLSSIATNASGSHLLTASWDSLIGVWDTTVPDSDEVPEDIPAEGGRRTKRRRVDGEKAIRKAPLTVLKSHTGRVSRAIFGTAGGGDSTAYSCGFDSTVRMWDTEIGLCTKTIVSLSHFLMRDIVNLCVFFDPTVRC
jgi:ribosome biogenesis protein YTM1